jgi:hypothetical protein
MGFQGHFGAISIVVENSFDDGCAPITFPGRREIREGRIPMATAPPRGRLYASATAMEAAAPSTQGHFM